MPTIDELADDYWALYVASNPSYASLIGNHDHDDQLEQFSGESLDTRASDLRALRHRIDASHPGDDPITRSLLITMIEADLTELETEILVAPPDPLLGVHSLNLRYSAQTGALEPSQADALAKRYAQIPNQLLDVAAHHRRLAEAGKTPAAVSVQRTIDQIDAYLASSIETDPFVTLTLPEGWTDEGRWRSTMETIVTGAIRPAYAEYREGLATEILAGARGDDRPGICHVDNGEAIYARLVERFVTVAHDPADIHNVGTVHATETLMDEYRRVGTEAFGTADSAEIFARLRSDRSLRYQSAEEMLSHAEEIVARAWGAIDGWLGARPDGPCRVLAVPETLAKDMPPAYYMAPALDGSRPGTYFLNTHEPHTRDRFASEAVAFHEAIPGHHFDRALAAQLTDIPHFRRIRVSNVHAEGWGLYSERLADEMGLYSGPVDRLGMLSADSWRAGRLVVDTGIHHRGWTRSQAVQFLRDHSGVNLPTIEQEVDRYIGWPGQALSYKMGHIEILRLRRKAEQELGSAFDIVGFHDTLLTSGGVSLPVLGDLVDAWIARTGSGEGGI